MPDEMIQMGRGVRGVRNSRPALPGPGVENSWAGTRDGWGWVILYAKMNRTKQRAREKGTWPFPLVLKVAYYGRMH